MGVPAINKILSRLTGIKGNIIGILCEVQNHLSRPAPQEQSRWKTAEMKEKYLHGGRY